MERLRNLRADVVLRLLALLGYALDDWTRLAYFPFLWRLDPLSGSGRKYCGTWFLRQPKWHAETVRHKVMI